MAHKPGGRPTNHTLKWLTGVPALGVRLAHVQKVERFGL